MPSNYKIITKFKEIKKLCKYCEETGYASIDFETSGHPINSSLFYPTILGVCFQPGFSYIIPLGHFDSPFKDNWLDILKYFYQKVLTNDNIVKIGWNFQFEYQVLHRYGLRPTGRLFDAMLAKYLLDEERPHDLKSQVRRFIPEFANYEEDYPGHKLPWDKKPLEGLSKYCGLDCDLTLRLMLYFEKQLIKGDFYNLFRNLYMMGVRVLAESSYAGFPIDVKYLNKLIKEYDIKITELDKELRNFPEVIKANNRLLKRKLEKLIDEVEDDISEIKKNIKKLKKEDPVENHKKINSELRKLDNRRDKINRYIARDFTTKKEKAILEPINFNSPAQLSELLFSKKGFNFKVVKFTTDTKTKKETDNPSTDESVLTELSKIDKSGFCSKLLEYRGLQKLQSTYIAGMKNHLIGDKVHGSFLLHGTVTNRLSSARPNLQNIPRSTTSSDIKKMFIPPKGYALLSLDYSQAELRVMAHMAKEQNMIRWFKEGRDIHLAVALKKNRCEDRYDEIKELLDKEDGSDEFIYWTKARKAAKTINFGIIYGQGANKLAENLGWDIEEAKVFLKEYFKIFPNIKKFIKKQHTFVKNKGWVRNIWGTKRRLPDIWSDEKYKVAEAERQCVNSPIQGAASNFALFSSVIIWEKVQRGEINIDLPQVATVHDSLMYFVKPKYIHGVVEELFKICANPDTKRWFGFEVNDVKMETDCELSLTSWGEMKKYNSSIDYSKELIN